MPPQNAVKHALLQAETAGATYDMVLQLPLLDGISCQQSGLCICITGSLSAFSADISGLQAFCSLTFTTPLRRGVQTGFMEVCGCKWQCLTKELTNYHMVMNMDIRSARTLFSVEVNPTRWDQLSLVFSCYSSPSRTPIVFKKRHSDVAGTLCQSASMGDKPACLHFTSSIKSWFLAPLWSQVSWLSAGTRPDLKPV